MGIEFERITEGECVLCGATANLTGEHKIKASLIRHEFGSRTTVFLGKDGPKFAQSPKSKVYHFKSKICQACNSSRTQAGDHAFDLLHRCLVRLRDEGSELTNESHTPNCTFPDCVEADYFRYFAKSCVASLQMLAGLGQGRLVRLSWALPPTTRSFLEFLRTADLPLNFHPAAT